MASSGGSERQTDHKEHDPRARNYRPGADALREDTRERHAGRLSDKEGTCKQRETAAALCRRHLRCIHLQRVVQHVETETRHEAGCACYQWNRSERDSRKAQG